MEGGKYSEWEMWIFFLEERKICRGKVIDNIFEKVGT